MEIVELLVLWNMIYQIVKEKHNQSSSLVIAVYCPFMLVLLYHFYQAKHGGGFTFQSFPINEAYRRSVIWNLSLALWKYEGWEISTKLKHVLFFPETWFPDNQMFKFRWSCNGYVAWEIVTDNLIFCYRLILLWLILEWMFLSK